MSDAVSVEELEAKMKKVLGEPEASSSPPPAAPEKPTAPEANPALAAKSAEQQPSTQTVPTPAPSATSVTAPVSPQVPEASNAQSKSNVATVAPLGWPAALKLIGIIGGVGLLVVGLSWGVLWLVSGSRAKTTQWEVPTVNLLEEWKPTHGTPNKKGD